MPRFNYVCKKCGDEFDALVVTEKEKVHCPSCGSSKTVKIFSPTNNDPKFRGSGFHKTDYVDKGKY